MHFCHTNEKVKEKAKIWPINNLTYFYIVLMLFFFCFLFPVFFLLGLFLLLLGRGGAFPFCLCMAWGFLTVCILSLPLNCRLLFL